MFHLIEEQLRQSFHAYLTSAYGIDIPIVTEQPKQSSFGEFALPVAFALARQLRKAPRAIAEELASKLAESGSAIEILGGLLVPEGTAPEDWTPQLAQETFEFLKRQRGQEAREAVRNLAIWAVVLFFGNGLVSFRISPTSSTGEPDVKAEEALSPSGEEAQA